MIMAKAIEQEELPHHTGRRSGTKYILTHGIRSGVERLAIGLRLKAPTPDDQLYDEVRERIGKLIGNALQDVEVMNVDATELGRLVLERANQFGPNCHIVSTCPEVALPGFGETLHINRLIDFHGDRLGIGPRPGFPSLSEQVRQQVERASGNPFVIAEDGVFTGGTLYDLITEIQRQGGEVVAVVAGFVFNRATSVGGQLHELQSKVEIVSVIEHDQNLLDWMPDHDFLPFLPNCGRVLGVRFGPAVQPYYSRNGTSYSVPYLTPFCQMKAWASIPERAAAGFTHDCISLAQKVYNRLEDLNKTSITVGMVTAGRVQPHVSMPIQLGRHDDVLGITDKKIAMDTRHRQQQRVFSYLEYLRARVPSLGHEF